MPTKQVNCQMGAGRRGVACCGVAYCGVACVSWRSMLALMVPAAYQTC